MAYSAGTQAALERIKAQKKTNTTNAQAPTTNARQSGYSQGTQAALDRIAEQKRANAAAAQEATRRALEARNPTVSGTQAREIIKKSLDTATASGLLSAGLGPVNTQQSTPMQAPAGKSYTRDALDRITGNANPQTQYVDAVRAGSAVLQKEVRDNIADDVRITRSDVDQVARNTSGALPAYEPAKTINGIDAAPLDKARAAYEAAESAYTAAKTNYEAYQIALNNGNFDIKLLDNVYGSRAELVEQVNATKQRRDEMETRLNATSGGYGFDENVIKREGSSFGSTVANWAEGLASQLQRGMQAAGAQSVYKTSMLGNITQPKGEKDLDFADRYAADTLETSKQQLRDLGLKQQQRASELNERYGTEYLTGAEKTVHDVVTGLGSTLPSVALGFVPGIGQGLSITAMVLGVAGQEAAAAYAGGADYGDSLMFGALKGLVEGGTELAGNAAIKGISTLARGAAKAFPRTANAMLKAAGYLDNGLTSILPTGVRNISGVAGEAFEEALASMIDPFLQRLTNIDPNAKLDWSQVADDAMLGAIISVILGGAGSLASRGISTLQQNQYTTQLMKRINNAEANELNTSVYAGLVEELIESGITKANQIRLKNTMNKMLARSEANLEAQEAAPPAPPSVGARTARPAPTTPSTSEVAQRIIEGIDRAVVTDEVMDTAAGILESDEFSDVDRNAIAEALLRARERTKSTPGTENAETQETAPVLPPVQPDITKINDNIADSTNVSQETRTIMNKISETTGVKINIADNLQAPEGASDAVRRSGLNGWYDPATRTINLNSSRLTTDAAILTTAMHEVVHDIQQSDAAFHTELADAVRGLMGAETFNAALNELPAAYRDMSAETREAEVVANYLQEQFGNEQSMSRIMSEKPGVVRRVLDAIRNWIANISSRLTTTAADRATATQLRQLERRIGKMMRGAGENAQSGGELVINRYISRLDAQAALSKLTGKDLVNDETGIVAQVNRAQQKKLISDAAVSKSVSNGFNAGKHYTAAANIAELWTSATLIESRTDNNSEKNVLSIKRFSAPLRFGTERADAYITAKESLDAGHRIYSLELTDIKKVPASHDHAPQQGSNTADTGLYDGIVTQPADSVNTQTALTRENIERNLDKLPKYSIAYHGTPHTFSEFLLDHIGEGEGAQGGGAKYSLADGDAEVEAGSLKLGDADNNRGRWTKKEKTYWDIGAKLRGEYENRSYRFAVQEAVYGDSETVSRVDWEDAPAVRWLEAGFHGKEPEFAYGRRYGKIPESGRSFNYADNSPEDGVSILPNTSRDKVYDMWYGDEPMVYVSGWYFGDRGSDGEPLLLDAKAITKEEYDSPTRGVDVRYSLSEAGAAENKRTVAAMQPVATLTGDEFRNESGTVLQKIGKFFKGVGSVENPDIGAISLTESGVRDSLSHGFGNEKIAAFAAVPDVLREGKVIQSSDNYEGRNYDTFVIAAPVTINKTPYFEGVVVMRQESNSIQRYYMHEVWTENEETGARSQTDVTQKGKLASGSPASTVNSVLQDLWNVKREISGGANNAPMYSAADSDYTQFLDAYPDVRAEALTEGARELFENAWSGIANNEELSISEALRLSDYVIELAETYDDAQESGDNASAQSAREKLVSFDDGTESDYGERKIIKMTKAAAEAHRVTLNELDETPTAVEVAAETPPPDAVAAPPAEPIPPRGNVGAGFKPARSESSEQSQKKTTQQTAQAERAATRAAAVAKFTGVGEAAIKETERLREGFKDVKPEARVAAKQENTRRMADNIADEFGVRSAKSREKLFGFLDDMSALVRAGKSPDFVKLESLARGAAELALRRQFPAASSANLSPVEVAEANAALEIAARELTNDILSAFADGRNTKGRRSAAARIPALSAPYMNLVEMFGAYPQGEKAARIFPVPLNTDPNDKNKRVSKLLRNAAEASVTPPETLKLLEKATLEQAFTYTKESLAPHMEDALTRVTPDTLDAQIGRLGAIFDERGIRQLPLSLQEVADFTELYDQLNNAKRYQDATDVWIKLSMFATWGGQSVAGWRMLKMKGPGGELSKMESEVKRFNKADGGNYELPDSIRDKVLGNAEQGIPPLDMEDDDAVAAVEAEFVSWLAARKPATRREKFRKWRYTAMLTNPVTWIRNFIGNASMSAINISAKPLERAMQRAFLPQDQRTATTQRSTKETREYAQKSYGEIADILRGDNPADLTARVRAERVKFKRRFANAMDELTDAAMNGVPASEKSAVKKALSLLSDSKFLKMYYTNALSDYITAQGIDVSETNESLETMKSLNAARQYAMDEALRLTYRQNNKFSKLYNKLLTSAFLTGAGESGPGFSDELRMMIIGGAMPYAKVPSNILSTALNITPAGFIYDTARVMYQAGAEHNGKSMPPNARAIAISKLAQSVSGSLLLTTLGVFGSLMGTIRIKQPDDDKGDSDYQSGRRSYSLEMFGISIPLAWAAPLSVPLFVGATAAEAVQGKLSKLGGDDSFFGVVGTIAAGLVDPVFEMSMVKGVNDLLQGIRYSENGGALILGLGASIIESYYVQAWPSALARLAAVFDSAQRRTTANPENEIPDGLERSFLSMAYRIPGIRNLVLEPKVDVWGREMRSEDVAMRILNNLLLPAYISKIVEPVFDQELGRLYDTFSYKERLPQGVDAEQAAQLRNMVYPSATPQTFTFEGESGHRLSDEEYTKLARAAGKLKYDLAAEYINSETYALLSDAERAEGLDLIYRYANSMARYEMYGDKVSTTKTDIAARDIAKGAGLSVGEWLSVRKRLNASPAEGATDEEKRQLKAEKSEFLVGLGLGDKETYTIANVIDGLGVTDDNMQTLIDNDVPPATYFEMYAQYGNNYKPGRDTALIERELKLNNPTARQYWNRAQLADPALANRITGKLNAIKAIIALPLADKQKISLAAALGIGVNANDIQEAIDAGITANDALRYAVMQDAYANISKTKGNSSSLAAMMFAVDALDDPKYTAEQKNALYGVFPMYQIIPVNADVGDIEALKAAGVTDWLPLRAKWVELGENGDEDSAKNFKYALWLYRENGYDVATQELIGKAVNSSAYQSSTSYANAVYKGAVLENYSLWPLWDEWTQYKRELAKANGKTSISSQADINQALGFFANKRGQLTDTERRVLYAFSTNTNASKANIISWGKQSLTSLNEAA